MKKILSTLKQKWTEYLIEVLVITVGILGAFALNSWNDKRQARTEEKIVLTQLKSEFKSNLDQLNDKIQIRNKLILSCKGLLQFLDQGNQPNNDTLLNYLSKTSYVPTFDPVISELSSSGDLHLISNHELKRLLSVWKSEIIQVTEEETSWRRFKENHYVPFLIRTTNYRNIINAGIKNKISAIYQISDVKSTYEEIGESERISNSWNALQSEQDFEDYLARAINQARIANTQSEKLKESINKIIHLIDLELNTSH